MTRGSSCILASITPPSISASTLRAARRVKEEVDADVRVMDLRWLAPLNAAAIVQQASQCERVLIVDEGRSAGVGEGVMTALVEGLDDLPLATTGAEGTGRDQHSDATPHPHSPWYVASGWQRRRS